MILDDNEGLAQSSAPSESYYEQTKERRKLGQLLREIGHMEKIARSTREPAFSFPSRLFDLRDSNSD